MKVLLALALLALPLHAQGTKADYDRAEQLGSKARSLVTSARPRVLWTEDGKSAFLRTGTTLRKVDLASGRISDSNEAELKTAKISLAEIPLVPFRSGRSRQSTEAQDLSVENDTPDPIQVNWLGFDGGAKSFGVIEPGKTWVQSTFTGHLWTFSGKDGKPIGMVVTPPHGGTAKITGKPPVERQRERERSDLAPDGKTRASIQNRTSLVLRPVSDGPQATLSEAPKGEHFEGPLAWSPDSKHLVASRAVDVETRQVTLVHSSPKNQLQPRTEMINYPKPGDAISQPLPRLFDAVTKREIPIDNTLFKNPWSITELAWAPDSSEFTFVYNQRGHQVMRILGVRASDGAVRVIREETTKTFIDYSQKFYLKRLPATRELLWASEQDGWNHLYLIDEISGKVKNQITKGAWNMHEVVDVDVEKRTIVFKVLGAIPGQDPYYTHFARVNFDGTGLTPLTRSNGTHKVDFSPDGKFLTATWSRVDQPPVTEIRRADNGELVCEISRDDDAALVKTGWSRPEPFSAKGRDGKTDIYGVIVKPSNFDPAKRYPVIETIYSGPHDFFVPKSFNAWMGMNKMAELGFILVQIDGMGTNWRSRAFHDVAWKNLADAGLPDHIAWLKAAATTRPWMDLSKVGIYGGSAGGQNSLSAMLHHGDFYKACVSDCGCHDNRMDKIWWNEAWMGWPVDESYVRNSNVTDAAKLQGKLMLVVGEVDHNVDPSSTLQVANALQKADKDFELLIVTGADHGAAETPYGSRRRADFFVRNLLGVEPRR